MSGFWGSTLGCLYLLVGCLFAIFLDQEEDSDMRLVARIVLWPVFPLIGMLVLLLGLRGRRRRS